MRNSKIFRLLSTFSKEEIKQFDLFLQSPYLNTETIVIDLWHILKPYLQKTQLEITNEIIFKTLFSNRSYDSKYLSYYISRLTKLAEEFLVFEVYKQKKELKSQTLLQVLLDRRLDQDFKTQHNKISKARKKEIISPEYFLNIYDEEYLYHEFHQITGEPYKDPFFNHFQTTIHHLDTYFLLKKLRLALEIIAFEKMYSKQFETAFMSEVDTLVNQQPYCDNHLVQLYYYAYKIQRTFDEDDLFLEFKGMIIQNQNNLQEAELKELLHYAINYVTVQIIKGKNDFMKESLILYGMMENHQLLFHNTFNILSDYLNIVSIACRNNNLVWAKDFIERNKNKLPEYSKDCYHYGLGIYHFYSKNFTKATDHLNLVYDVSKANIFYEINRRFILIRSMYEQNNQSNILELLKVDKEWVKRQKTISKEQKTGYLISINILVKLYNLRKGINDDIFNKGKVALPKRQKQLNVIEKMLNNAINLMAKGWLNEKINELQEKIR